MLLNNCHESCSTSIMIHDYKICIVAIPIWKQVGSCPWWRHQMEPFSALLVLCSGNSPVPGDFPAQRPVTRSFDVFFDLRLDKRWSKQSWGRIFETPSRSLLRHCNITCQDRYNESEQSIKNTLTHHTLKTDLPVKCGDRNGRVVHKHLAAYKTNFLRSKMAQCAIHRAYYP